MTRTIADWLTVDWHQSSEQIAKATGAAGDDMSKPMIIDGYEAVISETPDPVSGLLRGEFAGLPGGGGADFYAPDEDGLRREGSISLQIYLAEAAARGLLPRTPS